MLIPLFWLLFVASVYADDYRIVSTRFGKIRGKQIESDGGQRGIIFTGIPLARPPLRELRFQQAVLPDPWSGVLETVSYRNACLSEAKLTYKTYEGPVSEDCLYINVFTSQTCLESVSSFVKNMGSCFQGGCAVIAYVHGGARNIESPVVFKPEVLVNNFANEERNVIIVTLPYRTGVLGWFNPAPGVESSAYTNLALRDCYFGLEWIQKEIMSFGGDPKRATLMGHSSGGSQVQEIAVSPRSKGLFHQIIIMSGLNYGGDKTREVNSKFSQKFAQKLGCASSGDTFDSPRRVEQILGCLRTIPADKILETQLSFKDEIEEPYGTWIDEEIFPDTMRNLMKDAPQVNCLVGGVSAEMRGLRALVNEDGQVDVETLSWVCDHIGYERNYQNPEAFRRRCVEYYSNPNKTGALEDDIMFYVFNGQIADSFGRKAKSFVYSYEYSGAGAAYTKFSSQPSLGPSHTEDFLYVFGLHRNFSQFTEKDRNIEKIYSGILAKYVNTGNPSPYDGQKWEPWNHQRRNYFVIDFDKNFAMPGQRESYYREAYNFWEKEVPAEAGDWTPLALFPPGADMYVMNAISLAKLSIMQNKTRFMDKSLLGAEKIHETWEKHLVYLKAKRSVGIKRRSFVLSEEQIRLGPSISFRNAFLGFFLVLTGYFGIVHYLQMRKRREYQVISK